MMRKQVDNVNHKSAHDELDVLEAIHAVMHVVRARQHHVAVHDGQDLTHLEGKVLGFFARNPGATQSDLVAHSGRDKGQLARLINGLKDRGLLEAVADENDRRSIRLHLTEPARALHRAVQRQRKQLADVAASQLSADERAQLLKLLDKVRQTLQAEP